MNPFAYDADGSQECLELISRIRESESGWVVANDGKMVAYLDPDTTGWLKICIQSAWGGEVLPAMNDEEMLEFVNKPRRDLGLELVTGFRKN